MEAKLLTYERVQGLVFGAFGEASEPLHRLIDHLADSRVNVARPRGGRMGRRGQLWGEGCGGGSAQKESECCSHPQSVSFPEWPS